MASRLQVLHKHLLYWPPALYYVGEMQCDGHLPSLRRVRRPPLFPWNVLISPALAGTADCGAGDIAVSPAGQA